MDSFLYSTTTTEISWYALYQGDFQNRIKGKKVLEMGCGDCLNAAVMAALGAEVYANYIADSCGEIIKKLNSSFNFKYPNPDSSFSYRHFKKAGEEIFKHIEIIPVGTLERFNEFLSKKALNLKFRQWALKKETYIPSSLNLTLTRSQLIMYKTPRQVSKV